jgi:hypothetical protein
LGASSAHRWLACTASARLEQGFTDKGSEHAAEGTLAHAVVEARLSRLIAGKKPMTPTKLKKHDLYKAVMDEHADDYADYVMEHLAEVREHCPDAFVLLEEHVDFSEFVPDGYGTADTIIVADEELHVFDYKYGKGVPVSAEGNPQTRLYGLGAYLLFRDLYDIKRVVCHIVQPRLDSKSRETMTTEALLEWATNYVRPRALDAHEGKGEPTPGEHCRWCKFKNSCRAYAMRQLGIGRYQFHEPEHQEKLPVELQPGEIAAILTQVDELTRWAKSVKEYALEQALHNGVVYPGYKVVAGRSNRKISDTSEAMRLLLDAGHNLTDLVEPKGLTALEEIIGKKALASLLGDLIIKPQGKPVLAPEDDKREPINNAAAVFTPLDD